MKPATVGWAMLCGAALAGCSATPYDYRSDLELNERPGMFSGQKGAFVLRVGKAGEDDRPPPLKAVPAAPTGSEYEEFQRWRNSAQPSERREFEDWREWREWKRREAR